jgi:drug/metabolite transporter (DMT)-like permease
LNVPSGLAFDSLGNLFVANQGNGTIEDITPGGVGSVFASGLHGPTYLAFIPEPSAWALAGVGLVMLLSMRVWREIRKSAESRR